MVRAGDGEAEDRPGGKQLETMTDDAADAVTSPRKARSARSSDVVPDRGGAGLDVGRARRPTTQRRRSEILEAAAAIFREKGYEGTSTQDIADAVGLLKGSLYYYIDSKEDFLFEILKESHDGALAALDQVRSVEGDALDRLAALVEAEVEYSTANQVKVAVYFREFRSLSPERRALITAKGDVYTDFVRDLLREGQRDGVVDPKTDVRVVSLAIIGMLNSIALWYKPEGRHSPAKIARELAAVVVSGLASSEAVDAAGGLDSLRRRLQSGAGEAVGSRSATAAGGRRSSVAGAG